MVGIAGSAPDQRLFCLRKHGAGFAGLPFAQCGGAKRGYGGGGEYAEGRDHRKQGVAALILPPA